MPNESFPEIIKQGEVSVVALGPEFETLDDKNLDNVKEVVLHAAQSADPPWVVIDLSHTTFFSSSFIEVLFRAWNRLNARDGGKFSICRLSPYCAEVLQITHLDQVWQIYDSREDAVRAMLDGPATE